MPNKCENMEIKYTNTTHLLVITVENRLVWREQIREIQKFLVCKSNRYAEELWYLLPKLLKAVYFKTIITQLTYSISVWGGVGDCSDALLSKVELSNKNSWSDS